MRKYFGDKNLMKGLKTLTIMQGEVGGGGGGGGAMQPTTHIIACKNLRMTQYEHFTLC